MIPHHKRLDPDRPAARREGGVPGRQVKSVPHKLVDGRRGTFSVQDLMIGNLLGKNMKKVTDIGSKARRGADQAG